MDSISNVGYQEGHLPHNPIGNLDQDLKNLSGFLSSLVSPDGTIEDYNPEALTQNLSHLLSTLISTAMPSDEQQKANFQYLERLTQNSLYFMDQAFPGGVVKNGMDYHIPYVAVVNVMQHEISLYTQSIPTEPTLDTSSETYSAMNSYFGVFSSNPVVVDHSAPNAKFLNGDLKSFLQDGYGTMMNIFEAALTSQSLQNSFAPQTMNLLVTISHVYSELYVPMEAIVNKLDLKEATSWNNIESVNPTLYKDAQAFYDAFLSGDKGSILSEVGLLNPGSSQH